MYKNNSGLIAKTKVSKYKKGLCLTEKLVYKNPLLFFYETFSHKLKTHRTNSTFAIRTSRPTTKNCKRACLSAIAFLPTLKTIFFGNSSASNELNYDCERLIMNEHQQITFYISNCLFSPTSENQYGFSVWGVLAKLSVNPRNKPYTNTLGIIYHNLND